tara:strand:- start:4079 stop:4306 length:228 start_codon:yes stop_codon:yes gene_type:complete
MLNAFSSFESTSSVITVGRDIDHLALGYFAVPRSENKKGRVSDQKKEVKKAFTVLKETLSWEYLTIYWLVNLNIY